jgi:hypothetical protein
MRKVIFGLGIVVLAVLSGCAREDNEMFFRAELVEGGASVRIVEYLGDRFEVRIPSRIQKLPVTHIGQRTFENKNLNSITIPNSVTHIENNAFGRNQLSRVIIPSNVVHIGNSAFQGNQLTSVSIPNSVIHIGSDAFEGNQLSSVFIPNSVTHIGINSFSGNPNLDVLYNSDSTWLILGSREIENVIIPNTVIRIGDGAFSYSQLTTVTIPYSVTHIGRRAFANSQLTSVVIPESVTYFGGSAFAHTQLTSITIGGNMLLALDNPNLRSLADQITFHTGRHDELVFDRLYVNNGRVAGTYTRPNTRSLNWTRQ